VGHGVLKKWARLVTDSAIVVSLVASNAHIWKCNQHRIGDVGYQMKNDRGKSLTLSGSKNRKIGICWSPRAGIIWRGISALKLDAASGRGLQVLGLGTGGILRRMRRRAG